MQNVLDFYILGLPIDTDIGQCHFLQVKDYPDYYIHLQVIGITQYELLKSYGDDKSFDKATLSILKQLTLYEMIMTSDEITKYYEELFAFVFKNPDAFKLIKAEDFMQYRSLLLQMNGIKEKKFNPNPIIQKWIEKSQKFHDSLNADKLTLADMVTSVAIASGTAYNQVNEMTMYQLYMSFHRVAHIKNYDTMTLFATVSTEKIDIQSWCKHIDLFVEENYGLSRSSYDTKKKDIGLGTQNNARI